MPRALAIALPQGLGKYPTLDPDPRVERNVYAGTCVGSAVLAGSLPEPGMSDGEESKGQGLSQPRGEGEEGSRET